MSSILCVAIRVPEDPLWFCQHTARSPRVQRPNNSVLGFRIVVMYVRILESIWEFPQIGDPNIVP